MRLKGSMATCVTRSPWTARVFPNHSGMVGMSSRMTSSAAWYAAMPSATDAARSPSAMWPSTARLA